MKKIVFPCLLFLSLWANAQTDTTGLHFIEPPDSTAIGTPDGKLISKEIGIAGGTIISEDGRVELIFPDGALASNTSISIQPVTNLAPNGSGKAYQFEPSGIQFKKPVQIIFHYTDEEAETCPADQMVLAMQDQTGKWSLFEYDDWDSTAKLLKGTINHFSTGANSRKFKLSVSNDRLRTNKETLVGIVDIFDKLDGASFNRNDIIVWYVNDMQGGDRTVGTIEPIPLRGGKYMAARYTAPLTLPDQNPVKITAKILLSSKANRSIMIAKEASSKIQIYDGYEVKISAAWHKYPAGDLTVAFNESSDFTIDIETFSSPGSGIGTITTWTTGPINNSLLLLQDFRCPSKCKCEYLNESYCTGIINIAAITNLEISGTASGTKTVLVSFEPSKGMLPLFKVTCGTPSYTLGSMQIPAVPAKVKFDLKDGEQEQKFNFGEFAECKIIVKRKTN